MGLFNANAPLLSDVSLVFQIIVVFFLVLGFLIARVRRRFARHGIVMAAALVLHTISIILVMIPSLLRMGGLFQNLLNHLALIFVLHASLGVLVEGLGICFVAVWIHGGMSAKSCFGRRRLMQATIALWFGSLVIGICGYILFYPPT
jgi:uncharacterized membrane protein YozB (DUF420 family)